MAKHLDRDDELPEELYQFTPKEEEQIRRALPKDFPDLGRLETVLQPPGDWAYWPGVSLAVSFLMWIWVVVIPVWLTVRPPQGEDAASERTAALIALSVFAVFGVAFLGFGLFLLSRPWVKRGEHWLFFRDGAVRVLWGGWPLVFLWKDLTTRKLLAGPTGHKYEFATPNVKPVRLFVGTFFSRALPVNLLDRHILAVGPGMLRAIDAGRSVTFGPFAVSQQGLSYNQKQLAWPDLNRIEAAASADKGWKPQLLVYGGKKKWADVALSADVPNAWLMMWLVRKKVPRVVKDFDAFRNVLS